MLKVLLHHGFADVARAPRTIADGPEVSAPVPLSQTRIFFLQPAAGTPSNSSTVAAGSQGPGAIKVSLNSGSVNSFFEPTADGVARHAEGACQAAQGTAFVIGAEDALALLRGVIIGLRLVAARAPTRGASTIVFIGIPSSHLIVRLCSSRRIRRSPTEFRVLSVAAPHHVWRCALPSPVEIAAKARQEIARCCCYFADSPVACAYLCACSSSMCRSTKAASRSRRAFVSLTVRSVRVWASARFAVACVTISMN